MATGNSPIPLDDRIRAADRRIREHVRKTPLELSAGLSKALGLELYLKCEHLQRTGSFKFRGATNKLSTLGDEDRKRGVVTASSGNHGLAVATAAKRLGIPVTIYLPAAVSPVKLAGIEVLGAETCLVEGDAFFAERTARKTGREEGRKYVSPYNDLEIIAGQGTIGVELASQGEGLDAVFIAVGGGGLMSGIGGYLKAVSPDTRIIGCWPENSPALLRSLEEGRIIEVEESPTLSDGTAGGVDADSVTFPICQRVIDDTVTVTEEEIRTAMRDVAVHDRWMIEGAAAVPVAAARKLAGDFRGKRVAAILCGRNIALETFLKAVAAPL